MTCAHRPARNRANQPRRAGRAGPPGEDGQIMVLMVGFVLLALLLLTVVAAASSLYLGHKKLLSMADGAALAAADTFELHGGSAATDPDALLTNGGVTAAALGYLQGAETPESVTDVQLAAGTGTPDGHTAQVSLTGVVHPLIINVLVPGGITITVTGTARAHLLL